MTKTTGSPKRWRPRFSLRTLVLFMTLVCVYFGAWEATKRFGVPAVSEFARCDDSWFYIFGFDADSPLPFCVRLRSRRFTFDDERLGTNAIVYEERHYYLWIFGWFVRVKDEQVGWKPAS